MLFIRYPWLAAGVILTCDPIARVVAQQTQPATSPADTQAKHVGSVASPTPSALDAFIASAVAQHPSIRAARARVDAARARVSAAGTRPDPMLMAGVQNLPLGSNSMNGGGPDPMTMRMVGVSQMIPYPGKLALDHTAAEYEVAGATAALDAVTRQVTADVQDAYADLVFFDEALGVVTRNHDILADFVRLAEVRYSVGAAVQADVLKSHVELTRLAETASMLTEERTATLARLNALLGRPSDTPADHPTLPERVLRAALGPSLGSSPNDVRFTSSALGSRVADSPIPPVTTLQTMALHENPELREQTAMIAAQGARVALARKAHLPDFDVSLQYGQRGGGLPDMISASVAVPLPLSKRRKQNALATDAAAQLVALDADRATRVTLINAEIARLVAELERLRVQLALYSKTLLPQGRATITSTRVSYEVGKVDFLAVLDAQATVFTYETDYARARSDFAKSLAALERLVGQEVVR